ncbi:hypothetical protein L1887_30786 [Cichorium endivia]|nr:hypothetical protein L1887_30786 [Cichorium endivia]
MRLSIMMIKIIEDSSILNQPTNIKTKKLFLTGLSIYTSENTLHAAFEVKIIMGKISKRLKGFEFIEYTTEEDASAALKEMNGKKPLNPAQSGIEVSNSPKQVKSKYVKKSLTEARTDRK